jgi:O-antigen/teichoic acid export membrane protein
LIVSRPATSLRTASVRGAVWTTLASLATKFSTLVVQFALGWLLSKDDFALWGVAISLTIVTSCLTDGGVQKLLKQQPDRYRSLIGPATAVAFGFATVAAAMLALIATATPEIYRTEDVRPLVLVLAANALITVPLAITRTRMTIDLRFRDLALIEGAMQVVRGILTVAMAWAGFGAMSFVVPIVLVNVLQTIVQAIAGGLEDFNIRGVDVSSMRAVVKVSGWIMLGAACGAIVQRGDYFAIGLLSGDLLGVYFFGFQFAGSALAIVVNSAAAVLLPAMARVANDQVRLQAAFARSTRLSSFMVCPVSAGMFIFSPFAIHLLWDGKWDGAIPVAESVAISTMVRGVAFTAGSAIEAAGRWKARALIEGLNGLTLIASIAVAIEYAGADLVVLSWTIGVQRIVVGLLGLAVCGRLLGVGAAAPLRWTMRFAVPAALAAVISVEAGSLAGLTSEWSNLAARLFVFGVSWLLYAAMFGRSEWSELRRLR